MLLPEANPLLPLRAWAHTWQRSYMQNPFPLWPAHSAQMQQIYHSFIALLNFWTSFAHFLQIQLIILGVYIAAYLFSR